MWDGLPPPSFLSHGTLLQGESWSLEGCGLLSSLSVDKSGRWNIPGMRGLMTESETSHS